MTRLWCLGEWKVDDSHYGCEKQREKTFGWRSGDSFGSMDLRCWTIQMYTVIVSICLQISVSTCSSSNVNTYTMLILLIASHFLIKENHINAIFLKHFQYCIFSLGMLKKRKGRKRFKGFWHHRLNGHEFGWTPGVGDGQGSLASCSPWGRKESDTTEWLSWTQLK